MRSARAARAGASGPAADGVAGYPRFPFEAGNCEMPACAFMALGPDDDTITFLPGLFAASRRE